MFPLKIFSICNYQTTSLKTTGDMFPLKSFSTSKLSNDILLEKIINYPKNAPFVV